MKMFMLFFSIYWIWIGLKLNAWFTFIQEIACCCHFPIVRSDYSSAYQLNFLHSFVFLVCLLKEFIWCKEVFRMKTRKQKRFLFSFLKNQQSVPDVTKTPQHSICVCLYVFCLQMYLCLCLCLWVCVCSYVLWCWLLHTIICCFNGLLNGMTCGSIIFYLYYLSKATRVETYFKRKGNRSWLNAIRFFPAIVLAYLCVFCFILKYQSWEKKEELKIKTTIISNTDLLCLFFSLHMEIFWVFCSAYTFKRHKQFTNGINAKKNKTKCKIVTENLWQYSGRGLFLSFIFYTFS